MKMTKKDALKLEVLLRVPGSSFWPYCCWQGQPTGRTGSRNVRTLRHRVRHHGSTVYSPHWSRAIWEDLSGSKPSKATHRPTAAQLLAPSLGCSLPLAPGWKKPNILRGSDPTSGSARPSFRPSEHSRTVAVASGTRWRPTIRPARRWVSAALVSALRAAGRKSNFQYPTQLSSCGLPRS